jgi:cyanophycin synthetase
MVANGRLLYAVKRRPKAVTGDGRLTIAELVAQLEAQALRGPSWRRAKPITVDPLCEEALATQGWRADSVPPEGERIALRLIESTEWGGDVVDATGDVHPDNAEVAVRAARLFRLDNAGIDVITPDLSVPWHRNGAILNEVNFAPHFGGTESAREKMPQFIEQLMQGDGRIPVEACFGGDDALDAARRRQAEWAKTGLRCYCTSHDVTLDPSGSVMPLPAASLFDRTKALLMDRQVEALVLAIQTDEFLATGLPVDRLSGVQSCGGWISRHDHAGERAQASSQQVLLRVLRAYASPGLAAQGRDESAR